jgi:membrane protein required for colicin V production
VNSLDLTCLGLVLLAGVAGAVLGALSQAAQLAGVAAGWAGARLVAPALAPLLAGKVPAFAAHPVASVLAFAGCAFVATLVARGLVRLATPRGGAAGGANRGLGALLGAAQAALVVWVGVSALASWGKPLGLGRLRVDPTGSELVALAREWPAFGAGHRAPGREERGRKR